MRFIIVFFILTFLLLQSSCRLVDNTIKRRGISSENPTDSTPAPTDPAVVLKQWKATLPVAFTNDVALTSTTAQFPSTAMNDSGDTIIVWEQSDGAKKQIFKSEYRSGSWTHPTSLNDNISPDGQDAQYPKVALNDSGDAVIVWHQSDGTNKQIFKSEYRSGSWTHPTGLTDNISPDGQDAFNPYVDLSSTGDAVIVWRQLDGTLNQIFKSEYRSGAWTHPTGLTDNISPNGQHAYDVKVAMNSTGDTVIVWYQYDVSLNRQIFKSEYRSGTWTHPTGLTDNISPNTQHCYDPQVSLNDSGDTVIVWRQFTGTNDQVFKSEYRSGAWTHPTGLTDNISPNGQNASNPQVSMNNSGDSIITWSQSDGTTNQIFKSEYRSGAWTHPSGLSDNISPDGQFAYNRGVDINNTGEAIIAWTQSDGTNNKVFKSEYRSGAWTHPTGLTDNISPNGFAQDSVVKLNNNGDAIIAWYQSDGTNNQIFKSEYRSGSWTHPTGLTDNISPDNQKTEAPQLAVNASGDAVVVWAQSDGSRNQIFKSEYRSGSWTNPTGLTDNISPDGFNANFPKVKINDSGDTVIIWKQFFLGDRIYKSEYRSGAWTHPIDINDYITPGTTNADYHNLALNNSGDTIIVWQQYNSPNTQIFKSEYRSGAWTHPSSQSDNISPNGGDCYSPDVSLNDSGEAIIAWQQSDGSHFQIFKSEYRSGAWTHPSGLTDNISSDGQSTTNPILSMNDNGDAIIVWRQSDGTNNQIFKSEYRSGTWTHPSGLTDNISPDGQAASNPLVSLNDSGNAMIVWQQSNGTNETFFKSEYSSGSWTHPTSLSDHMLLGTQIATDIRMSFNNSAQAIITWTDDSNRILSTDNFSGSWVDPYYVKSTTTPYINYEFVQSKASEKGYLLFSEKSGDTKKNGISLYEFKQ